MMKPRTKSPFLNHPVTLYALFYDGLRVDMGLNHPGEPITWENYSFVIRDPQMFTLVQVARDPATPTALFGALAVGLAGVLTDITTLILIRSYSDYKAIYKTLAFHSFYSIWTSYVMISLFIENSSFIMGNAIVVLLVSIILYFIAYYVSKATIRLFDSRKLLDKKTHSFRE